jgi:hypothetical protein
VKYLKKFEGFSNNEINELIDKNQTFVYKISRSYNNKSNKLSEELINYDISGFTSEFKNGVFKIYPDDEFIKLYKKYCHENNLQYNYLIFHIEITTKYLLGGYNFLDVYNLMDDNLKGLSLGYKLYKYILNDIYFIMTNKDILPESKNLWYNLLQDDGVYSGTNENFNIIIKKDIEDFKLKEIIDKVSEFNLTYDNNLNKKINELYG